MDQPYPVDLRRNTNCPELSVVSVAPFDPAAAAWLAQCVHRKGHAAEKASLRYLGLARRELDCCSAVANGAPRPGSTGDTDTAHRYRVAVSRTVQFLHSKLIQDCDETVDEGETLRRHRMVQRARPRRAKHRSVSGVAGASSADARNESNGRPKRAASGGRCG